MHSTYWMPINNSLATQYTFSAWVYSDGPTADLYLFMKEENETDYYTLVAYATTATRGKWVKIQATVSVPAHIKKLNLRIDNNGGGTVYFDDVELKKTSGVTSEIIEENNYYAFGMKHEGYNNVTTSSDPALKYKYLGQERQDEMELNWDTFRYRNYDYTIGRFFGVDPISEQFYTISPYQFAHNNPIWKIELEGLEGQETQGEDKVNREPVKSFIVAGRAEVKMVQETAEEASKKSGGKLVGNIAKAGGTVFALLTNYMSPNYGGETSESVIHGRSGPMNMGLPIDEVKMAVDDWKHEAFVTNLSQVGVEKSDKSEVIYRGGAFTDSNFTPRPGIDDGAGPKSGLSTFKDPIKAANGNNKVQALNAGLLRSWGFQLTETPDGHVGIRPPSQKLLEYWAASRGKDPGTDPAQLLTQMVKAARIEEIKIPK
ncbi:hypothetical protein GWA97_13705 [Flavobacterium sp. LaA7.5]|nr:hypothetical protein [Flavobacterium salilacus subsp. altitudinum]